MCVCVSIECVCVCVCVYVSIECILGPGCELAEHDDGFLGLPNSMLTVLTHHSVDTRDVPHVYMYIADVYTT